MITPYEASTTGYPLPDGPQASVSALTSDRVVLRILLQPRLCAQHLAGPAL